MLNKQTLTTGTNVMILSARDPPSSNRGRKESFSPIHSRHMLVKFTTISVAICVIIYLSHLCSLTTVCPIFRFYDRTLHETKFKQDKTNITANNTNHFDTNHKRPSGIITCYITYKFWKPNTGELQQIQNSPK